MTNAITLKKGELVKAPQTIGVYLFAGKEGAVYIGKAVNVKARLASHLQNAKRDTKEAAVVDAADKVKIIPTESEFKAFLLEAALIRKHHPKYNRIWKDDKSPLYIEITKGEYPKVLLVRKKDIEGRVKRAKGDYFGPFQSKRVTQQLIREIRKVVPFCTRKRISTRPCFHSKIGLCNPCPNAINSLKDREEKRKLKREYRRNVRQITKILKGKTEPVLKDLQLKIKKLSSKEKYEEALTLRNRLFRFERLISQTLGIKEDIFPQRDVDQSLKSLKELLKPYFPELSRLSRIEAYDVSSITQKQATASMVVLADGQVDKSHYRKFKIKTPGLVGDTKMLTEIIKRRFTHEWPKPALLVVDGGKPQVKVVLKTLGKLKLDIPTVGIAKVPDRLVIGIECFPTKRLPLTHPGFNLIRLIRDESHRFSRKYHLFLREKELLP